MAGSQQTTAEAQQTTAGAQPTTVLQVATTVEAQVTSSTAFVTTTEVTSTTASVTTEVTSTTAVTTSTCVPLSFAGSKFPFVVGSSANVKNDARVASSSSAIFLAGSFKGNLVTDTFSIQCRLLQGNASSANDYTPMLIKCVHFVVLARFYSRVFLCFPRMAADGTVNWILTVNKAALDKVFSCRLLIPISARLPADFVGMGFPAVVVSPDGSVWVQGWLINGFPITIGNLTLTGSGAFMGANAFILKVDAATGNVLWSNVMTGANPYLMTLDHANSRLYVTNQCELSRYGVLPTRPDVLISEPPSRSPFQITLM